MQKSANRANRNRSGVGAGELNNSLRVFKPIHNDNSLSPYKQEFKSMPLKARQDPDTKYVVDMNLMGSPTKQTSNKTGTNAVLYT